MLDVSLVPHIFLTFSVERTTLRPRGANAEAPRTEAKRTMARIMLQRRYDDIKVLPLLNWRNDQDPENMGKWQVDTRQKCARKYAKNKRFRVGGFVLKSFEISPNFLEFPRKISGILWEQNKMVLVLLPYSALLFVRFVVLRFNF